MYSCVKFQLKVAASREVAAISRLLQPGLGLPRTYLVRRWRAIPEIVILTIGNVSLVVVSA